MSWFWIILAVILLVVLFILWVNYSVRAVNLSESDSAEKDWTRFSPPSAKH